MAAPQQKVESGPKEIVVKPVQLGEIVINIVGLTPIILNCVSEKARHELLLPKGKKNAAEKQASEKHDPIAEFLSSPYKSVDSDMPTLITFMSSAFKGSMLTA